jgi:hypothetical protein
LGISIVVSEDSLHRALERMSAKPSQDWLAPQLLSSVQAWQYAVLVTSSDYPLQAFGELYRDRVDCENGFDKVYRYFHASGEAAFDDKGRRFFAGLLCPLDRSAD